jgi:ZipA, C-terminal FtsZ-binding domain
VLAKRLAITLDAELVDDKTRPLTDAGLGTIRAQLQTVQATMRAKGIEPGGARALRLFT